MGYSLLSRPAHLFSVVFLVAAVALVPVHRAEADATLHFTTISSAAQFPSPRGLAVDASDNLYVVDGSSGANDDSINIQKYTISSSDWTKAPLDQEHILGTQQYIAVGFDGTIYFTTSIPAHSLSNDTDNDNFQVIELDSDLAYMTGFGQYVEGSFDPVGLCLNESLVPSTPLVVVDAVNAAPGSNYVFLYKKSGEYFGVLPDHDSTCMTRATINGVGYYYVFDPGRDRIVVYDDDDSIVNTLGTDGQFNTPRAIAVDGAGNIYVADTGNNRIQKYTASTQAWTVWGGTSAGTDLGQFNAPQGIAVSSDGKVYVSDTGNVRVVLGLPFPRITLVGVPAAPTTKTSLTLTLGASGVSQYKYKLDDGSWSSDGIDLATNPTITLTRLAPGSHTLAVISGTGDGQWQAESDATTASWTVLSASTAPLGLLLQD